jgi:hypothetical protein
MPEICPAATGLATDSTLACHPKTAHLKTGDVGGAFLIARRFDPQTIETWRAEKASSTGRWSFGVEESFTGYEGFVRVGPRRGFHLLLVEEMEAGFVPVLPSSGPSTTRNPT